LVVSNLRVPAVDPPAVDPPAVDPPEVLPPEVLPPVVEASVAGSLLFVPSFPSKASFFSGRGFVVFLAALAESVSVAVQSAAYSITTFCDDFSPASVMHS